MEEYQKTLLEEVEADVADHFTKYISAEYVYHDYQHTRDVVEAVKLIGEGYALSPKEIEILQLAAWFHDTGHDQGSNNHEERSAVLARKYLLERDYSEEDLQTIEACIIATKIDAEPNNLLEQIICDADLSHLGSKLYWDRCWRVRQELMLTTGQAMTEKEWVDFELSFLENHQYYTQVAQEFYDKRKRKYIKQLKKHKLRLDPETVEILEEVEAKGKGKKKKNKQKKHAFVDGEQQELKQLNLGRGVETMFRTTYRTHVNLSAMADSKANLMLSLSSLLISNLILGIIFFYKSIQNKSILLPIAIIIIASLIALIYAVLATRPKVTEGKFTREDIEQKRANLLFFGNFYNMEIEDFHLGMMQMIKDSDFLYSSMTRDLYYLGKVLAQKYRYLRICYSVFMYGLIAAIFVFVLLYLFGGIDIKELLETAS